VKEQLTILIGDKSKGTFVMKVTTDQGVQRVVLAKINRAPDDAHVTLGSVVKGFGNEHDKIARRRCVSRAL